MKKNTFKVKLLAYPLLLTAMMFATLEYANISIVGATGSCCTYGVDCPQGKGRDEPIMRCCFPWQEAPCSQSKRNYCRESC